MGILRLLLALSVVVFHCDGSLSGKVLVGGEFAVKLFFIISGFYMALILHEKYTGAGSVRVFYGNRLLRLLPTYYIMMAAALLIPLVLGWVTGRPVTCGQMAVWQTHGPSLTPSMAAALKWVQLSPLGQEWAAAGSLDTVTGKLDFGPVQTAVGEVPLFYFLLIPPAWSLSLELQFYALAPFFVRRSVRCLAWVFLITLGLRWLLPLVPFSTSKFWRDHTLFCELGYFTLGILSHRVYGAVPRVPWLRAVSTRGGWILAGVMGWLILYPWFPTIGRGPATALLLAATIPFLVSFTARNSWDRALGELSYAVYLSHWVIKGIWVGVATRFPEWDSLAPLKFTGVVIVLSVATAAAIHWWIERPIDRFRQRRWAARRAVASARP